MRALLLGGNVSLVLAAVLGVLAASNGRLQKLAHEQALARVSLAGASALRAVEHAREDLPRLAARLAEECAPAAEDEHALRPRLERFRAAERLTACGIALGGEPVAFVGRGSPWQTLARAAAGTGESFVLRMGTGAPLLIGARAPLRGGAPHASAVVVLSLDETFQSGISAQVGLPVAIVDRERALEATPAVSPARASLRARVLDSEAPAAERIAEQGVYVAAEPLRAPSGEILGVVETSLPATGITASLRRLLRSLLVISAFVAGLAGLFSVLLGRSLVRPVEALTEASARIGKGDLATPIPRGYAAEMGRLAESMEQMRARLLALTTELWQRQRQAEAVLTGIVEGVYAVDRERRIRYVNPQAAALLGRAPEQILGRFCGDVLQPRDEDGVRPCEDRCPILHARFRGSTRATERLSLPDGTTRTVVIASAPPGAEEVETPSLWGGAAAQFQVLRDETEIEATRRLRDAVLANISHEFRTPLSAQLASIELLRERLPELASPEARELVLSLERGALRLTQLIDNLLESVRIESGKDSIRRKPVPLDEVVEEAVDSTAPLAQLREQRLEVDLPYPLPPISGDAPRLVQVLVNLLANASKFAPQGTRIRIGGEVSPDDVMLWVEDQGPGLSAWPAPSRAEPFLRSLGEEPEESGMGLGLFIVRSIVERHGGRIEVRAGAGDAGTRMCIVLPRRAGDEDPGR